MQIINHTRAVADCSIGYATDGQAHLILAVKATYEYTPTGEVIFAEQQIALFDSDQFVGDPATTSHEFENDFALRKARCDILLTGHAYAPQGRPAPLVGVGLRVGERMKVFNVTGTRHWQAGLLTITPGKPQPFTKQRIGYEVAFGGVDLSGKTIESYDLNPCGRGYFKHLKHSNIDGKPMPQTEALTSPITSPTGKYIPQSLGPIARNAMPRAGYAGTYDAAWIDERMPVLPEDFDERYYQAAPADQQIDALRSSEEIVMVNLSCQAEIRFKLPDLALNVQLQPKKGNAETHAARADTLILEPDHNRFSVVWRVTRPIRQSLQEWEHAIVGNASASRSAKESVISLDVMREGLRQLASHKTPRS